MESDCVFETAVQRVRDEKTVRRELAIGSRNTDMSWKRMRERSSARELSAMSTAESIWRQGLKRGIRANKEGDKINVVELSASKGLMKA